MIRMRATGIWTISLVDWFFCYTQLRRKETKKFKFSHFSNETRRRFYDVPREKLAGAELRSPANGTKSSRLHVRMGRCSACYSQEVWMWERAEPKRRRTKTTANGSVQTKQQMRGVKSLNFLKLNNSRKQSTQKTGSGLLQSGSEGRPGSSSPTQGETTREASHGLGFVTSVNLPRGLVGRGASEANAREKKKKRL